MIFVNTGIKNSHNILLLLLNLKSQSNVQNHQSRSFQKYNVNFRLNEKINKN